jgi:hypothetical protein
VGAPDDYFKNLEEKKLERNVDLTIPEIENKSIESAFDNLNLGCKENYNPHNARNSGNAFGFGSGNKQGIKVARASTLVKEDQHIPILALN